MAQEKLIQSRSVTFEPYLSEFEIRISLLIRVIQFLILLMLGHHLFKHDFFKILKLLIPARGEF